MYLDLVAAHKGLIKEKKSLETSLKVMTLAPTANVNKTSHDFENRSTLDSPSDGKVTFLLLLTPKNIKHFC